MFNSNDGYSLADIATAVSGGGRNGDGFFGGSGWWIILLFLFAWGGFGNNNGGNGNVTPTIYGLDSLASTRDGFYDINTGMLNGFAATTAAVNANASALQNELSSLALQSCQNANAITSAINGVTVGGLQNTFALTQQLSNIQAAQQLANCQTDQNIASSFAQLNYNLATEACADRNAITSGVRDIIDNANNNTRAILDFLVQDRITALTNENQALKGQISQSEQNAYLISQLKPSPGPAYIVPNPYGFNNMGFYYGAGNIIA